MRLTLSELQGDVTEPQMIQITHAQIRYESRKNTICNKTIHKVYLFMTKLFKVYLVGHLFIEVLKLTLLVNRKLQVGISLDCQL